MKEIWYKKYTMSRVEAERLSPREYTIRFLDMDPETTHKVTVDVDCASSQEFIDQLDRSHWRYVKGLEIREWVEVTNYGQIGFPNLDPVLPWGHPEMFYILTRTFQPAGVVFDPPPIGRSTLCIRKGQKVFLFGGGACGGSLGVKIRNSSGTYYVVLKYDRESEEYSAEVVSEMPEEKSPSVWLNLLKFSESEHAPAYQP